MKNEIIFKDLAKTTHVYLIDDTVKGVLQPAYTGPYKMTEKGDKTFKVLVKGKLATVVIERTKPASSLTNCEKVESQPCWVRYW